MTTATTATVAGGHRLGTTVVALEVPQTEEALGMTEVIVVLAWKAPVDLEGVTGTKGGTVGLSTPAATLAIPAAAVTGTTEVTVLQAVFPPQAMGRQSTPVAGGVNGTIGVGMPAVKGARCHGTADQGQQPKLGEDRQDRGRLMSSA